MSDEGTVHACDRCGAEGWAELGELQPDDWSRRDGQNVCARCCIELDSAYLRDCGWSWVRSALDDLPDAGVWADPLGEVRHQRLLQAVLVQQRRDGYGQLTLDGAA